MAEISTVQPEWVSPPGSIVARALSAKRVDLEGLADSLGITTQNARRLLDGTVAVDSVLAEGLSMLLGSTPAFWLRCEQTYREDIKRNLASYVDDEARRWLAQLPIKELADFGWIRRFKDPIEQAGECFRFFGIFGVEGWRQKNAEMLSGANFRTSETFSSDPVATSAWLRWAEDRAEAIACQPFNRAGFAACLETIRPLTRNHHPERFVPKMRDICASAGVALVIGPAPKTCRASGATWLIRPRKAMIVLSFRYYSDDQFWFSFFHEAGHLILHHEQNIFIESGDIESDNREQEANSFALNKLIPARELQSMLLLPPEYEAYISFARRLGISPGIIVGQMQRLGHLPHSWLNKAKRRFDWGGIYADGAIL